MKAFISLAVLALIISIQAGFPVAGQDIEYANRKWLQRNRTLYRIEVEPETTWKEAFVQCKREKMQLIRPSADSNRVELQNFIKSKFKQFPSFWAENNATATTLMQKLGFKKGRKGKSCNKIDHKTFQIKAEECHQYLGFICETALRSGPSQFQINRTKYYIEPEAKYSCIDARFICARLNMTMVVLDPFKKNVLLNDHLFVNYGSQVSYWLSTNEGSRTAECLPWSRSSRIDADSHHGVICETTVPRSGLTFRHLFLIGSVSVMLALSLIVLCIFKCCLSKKSVDKHQEFHNEEE